MIRNTLLICAGLIAGLALSVSAATLVVNPSSSLLAICQQILGVSVTTPTPSPAPTPTPTPNPVPSSSTGSISLSNVYLTGYADGDNTPPGSPVVDLDGHHGLAGGDCTYEHPTTLAVGHVITNGVDKGDFAYGTKFYVPALKCYFSAQDTCGDGNTPQNQPCHSLKTADKGATLWLDLYVGPKGTASCEENMTKLYDVIKNPVAGLPVKVGNICN